MAAGERPQPKTFGKQSALASMKKPGRANLGVVPDNAAARKNRLALLARRAAIRAEL